MLIGSCSHVTYGGIKIPPDYTGAIVLADGNISIGYDRLKNNKARLLGGIIENESQCSPMRIISGRLLLGESKYFSHLYTINIPITLIFSIAIGIIFLVRHHRNKCC